MQNNSSTRSPHYLSLIAGFVLIVTALGFAFFPHTAEADPNIYVANYRGNTISRADLDGNNGEDLGNLNNTLDRPQGIALDLSNGYMYVAMKAAIQYPVRTWTGTMEKILATSTIL